MILNCSSIYLPSKLPIRTVCFASASGTNTDQLRLQLDGLHKEAENTRAKANSVRLRLMRLSEAAENLRQRAAVSVQVGKENEARELLFQKKKVMEAIEKSHSRIILLDELAAKLNEVITVKENKLIGNVALDIDTGRGTESSPVIFVSPKEEAQESFNQNEDFVEPSPDAAQDDELKGVAESLAKLQSDSERNDYEGSMDGEVRNEVHNVPLKLQEVSSYEDFLDHVDSQLNAIEVELVTMLKYSKLVLESKENLENSKVQHVHKILEDVRHARDRIASIKGAEMRAR